MNDDQRLSMLDRRAADATAALDDAVQQVPVPEPDLGAPRRTVRRFLPLAVAAGLAVVALVGAALVFDDDEQSTIADQPQGITRLALPDPESLGYRIVGAFDPSSAPEPPAGLDLTVTVHSPANAEEPWGTTVLTWAVPADLSTLDGETVDVGGPEAALRTDGGVVSVGWLDDGDVRYVRSADTTADDLVELVRRAIDAGFTTGQALPGHQILHTAPMNDLYPMAGQGVTTGDLGGIAYESNGGVLVVSTTAGSEAKWNAARVLAVDAEPLTVRGSDAVRADFGDGMTEVSWLEADGTLVRVSSHGEDIPTAVLEKLEPISDAMLADLVEQFGTGEHVERHSFDERGEEIGASEPGDGPEPILPDASTSSTVTDGSIPIAEVSTEDGGVTVRAALRQNAGAYYVDLDAEGESGGSGVSMPVEDLETNTVLRHRFTFEDWSGVAVGGVIGPDVGPLQIVDAETGEPVDASGPSTATIGGSNHVVFLATVGPEYRDRDLVVVGTSAGGEEIRLDAPAQP